MSSLAATSEPHVKYRRNDSRLQASSIARGECRELGNEVGVSSSSLIDAACRGRSPSLAVCQLEHSVEAEVSPAFAWNWQTNIKNWDDPPAQFQLDGPFAEGSWGTTRFPGQEPIRWHIRDVRPGASFMIEILLDRAVLLFEWLFEAVATHRTRITQRIVLSGDNAAAYADQVRVGFGSTLAEGMKRIAAALVSAETITGH